MARGAPCHHVFVRGDAHSPLKDERERAGLREKKKIGTEGTWLASLQGSCKTSRRVCDSSRRPATSRVPLLSSPIRTRTHQVRLRPARILRARVSSGADAGTTSWLVRLEFTGSKTKSFRRFFFNTKEIIPGWVMLSQCVVDCQKFQPTFKDPILCKTIFTSVSSSLCLFPLLLLRMVPGNRRHLSLVSDHTSNQVFAPPL